MSENLSSVGLFADRMSGRSKSRSGGALGGAAFGLVDLVVVLIEPLTTLV